MQVVKARLKSAILVDENNAMHQLQAINIEGLKSWKNFYEVVSQMLRESFGQRMHVDFNYYGALPPKELDLERYNNRHKFFEKLRYDGINIYKGECYIQPDKSLVEKGVDILIALDIYQFSVYNYPYLVLFSGDADYYPAIERAQKNGSHVIAILTKERPAVKLSKLVNEIIWLEDIVSKMENKALSK